MSGQGPALVNTATLTFRNQGPHVVCWMVFKDNKTEPLLLGSMPRCADVPELFGQFQELMKNVVRHMSEDVGEPIFGPATGDTVQ